MVVSGGWLCSGSYHRPPATTHLPFEGACMRKHSLAVAIAFVVVAFVFLDLVDAPVEGQSGTVSTAAVPTEKGGQDVFGAYDVAQWPKPLSTLPGHENWTWGAGQ